MRVGVNVALGPSPPDTSLSREDREADDGNDHAVDGPDRDVGDGQPEGDAAGDHLDLEFEAGLIAVEQDAHRPLPMSR